MGIALVRERLKTLERDATVYDLVGPVLRVSSNGVVKEA